MSYYRRAKVTIDCGVYESGMGVAYLSLGGDPQTQFGALGTLDGGIPDCVTIEYLPEPVVFTDGDAVYSTFDGATRVRVAGRWVWARDGTPVVHYGDDFYAGRVVDGSMLRVGAPVTP